VLQERLLKHLLLYLDFLPEVTQKRQVIVVALETLKESSETAVNSLRMAAAAKLYEMSRLSTSAAARLAGVSRSVFWTRLDDYNVSTFDLTDEDLYEETRLALCLLFSVLSPRPREWHRHDVSPLKGQPLVSNSPSGP